MLVNYSEVVDIVKNKAVDGIVAVYRDTLVKLLEFIGEVRFEEFVEVMKAMEKWDDARDLFTGEFFSYNLLVDLVNHNKAYRDDFKRWVEYGVDDDAMWGIIKVNRKRLNSYLRLYFGLFRINEKGLVKGGKCVGSFDSNVLELYVYYLCVGLMREVVNK